MKMVTCPQCDNGAYSFHGHSWQCEFCDGLAKVEQTRFWFNKFGTWDFKILPWIGGDEFDRKTLVIPFFTAALVIAYGKYEVVDEQILADNYMSLMKPSSIEITDKMIERAKVRRLEKEDSNSIDTPPGS